MNILQIMGCISDQYASMERYLVEKAKVLKESGNGFLVVYENIPKSTEFVEDFNRMGGTLLQFKLRKFYDLSYYKEIIKIIKKEDIDIVHSYFTPTCHYISIYLTVRRKKKLIRTAANLPLSINHREKSRKSYFLLYFSIRHKLLSLFVRKIMCRSKGVMNEFRELGISPEKLTVTPGGVDIEYYKFSSSAREEIREACSLNDKTLVLGVFCRLVGSKRIDELIKVFANLKILNQDIKLLIAGDGPEKSKLEKFVKNLKLDSYVKFLGHRNDIFKLYSALDIFCLSSCGEGMSNSILEAMASELPIIASDISSNQELVDDEKGGYLISFENDNEFQDRIEKLLNEKIRKKMGVYNRKKVISQYSVKSRVEKEFQIYEELIS